VCVQIIIIGQLQKILDICWRITVAMLQRLPVNITYTFNLHSAHCTCNQKLINRRDDFKFSH